ncbi:MAG: HNH endonuclease [Planctomycetota bacterium]|nr:MAG: HNH endonuclease [Planctomycetota bacterium]
MEESACAAPAEGSGAQQRGGAAFPLSAVARSSALDSSVLLLNAHYAALRIVSARRAFALLFKRDRHDRPVAEVVHVEDGRYTSYNFEDWAALSAFKREFEPARYDWIRTVRFDIAVPRIVRVLTYARLPRQEVKFNRRNLFARDGNQCQYCGKRFPTSELSLDHVIPRSQGGSTTWSNVVCACVRCNVRKGGRTPEQAHMRLIRPPVKPRRNPVLSVRLSDDRYASWKQFLNQAYWDVELR